MKSMHLPLLLMLAVLAAGCTQDEYAIEREFYFLQKQGVSILNNPDVTPPAQVNLVIQELSDFRDKYPKQVISVQSQFLMARILAATKQFDKAQDQLMRVKSDFASSEDIYTDAIYMRGQIYEKADRWDEALGQYKILMQAYPRTRRGMEIPLYIAGYYEKQFQPELMRTALRSAVEHYKSLSLRYSGSPLSLQAQLMVAQSYAKLENWPDVIETLQGAIDMFKAKTPVDSILLDLANIYLGKLKDPARAQEILLDLKKIYPNSPSVKIADIMLERIEKTKK